MSASVFIRNDSQKGSGHCISVGLRNIGSEVVMPCTKAPLEPGDEVTTVVYLGVELVVRDTV
jgi:hypothetical protein